MVNEEGRENETIASIRNATLDECEAIARAVSKRLFDMRAKGFPGGDRLAVGEAAANEVASAIAALHAPVSEEKKDD
jgi:hypothetical protein